MSEFDKGALRYVFPEELLRYFDIVESGIHTDKPTGEDYLEVVFEEKNTLPEGYSKDAYESKGFFATTVTLQNGIPIETVSKMLGHTNIHTTQHYAKVLDSKISKDMEILQNGHLRIV